MNTFKRHPVDFGPIYAETASEGLILEPFNAASNLVFLIIALYFIQKTRLKVRDFPFLCTALPVLLIGFIGGTVFHATRSHWAWLVMDFLPIFILGFAATYYFWKGVLERSSLAGFAMLIGVVLTGLMRRSLPFSGEAAIPIGYSLIAANILIPAGIHAAKSKRGDGWLLGCAALSFVVAVVCRQVDMLELLPMGTHFLWHVFGGGSTFFVMEYLYRDEKSMLRKKPAVARGDCPSADR